MWMEYHTVIMSKWASMIFRSIVSGMQELGHYSEVVQEKGAHNASIGIFCF